MALGKAATINNRYSNCKGNLNENKFLVASVTFSVRLDVMAGKIVANNKGQKLPSGDGKMSANIKNPTLMKNANMKKE